MKLKVLMQILDEIREMNANLVSLLEWLEHTRRNDHGAKKMKPPERKP